MNVCESIDVNTLYAKGKGKDVVGTKTLFSKPFCNVREVTVKFWAHGRRVKQLR